MKRMGTGIGVLAVAMLLQQGALAQGAAGVWVGQAHVPPSATVPFRMELHEKGTEITGTVGVGPAKFAIKDGHAEGNVVHFTTTHDRRIVDSTHTEKLAQPVTFNYTAIVSGDQAHIVIVHADGTGSPNELDVERSK